MNRTGSIELSFGMIFSIIIMVAIIGVAVYAISAFLDIGQTSQFGLFHQQFQETIDEVWASSITDKVSSFSLPSSIELVCFGSLSGNIFNPEYEDEFKELKRYSSNFEQQNTNRFLYPSDKGGEFTYKKIGKIDLSAMNGFDCFEVKSGVLKIRLVKEEFDALVKIKHEDFLN